MADPTVLLSGIKSSLLASGSALPSSDTIKGAQDGISLLSLKSHLLVEYLQHLAFYILIKLRGESIKSEKYKQVVENLIDLRVYLDKGVKPIETKLRYQIDKVIRAAERLNREGQLQDLDATSKDALAYKPNPLALVLDRSDNNDTGTASQDPDGLYRPPRIASTALAAPSSRRGAATGSSATRRQNPNSTLREFVDSELSAAPQAHPSIGSNITSANGVARIQSSSARRAQIERDTYEEENYLRLPSTSSKRDRGQRRVDEVYGGEDFRVLDQELYDFGGASGGRNDRNGKDGFGDESLVQRARKRSNVNVDHGDDFDGDSERRGNGTGPGRIGDKFKKRKKVLSARRKK